MLALRAVRARGWQSCRMRLFVAVRPPEAVLEHLERALAGVAELADGGGVRWSAPENRHLTIGFFGEVPDGAIDELVNALDEATREATSFRLRLQGAGVFAARALWIGAGADVEQMVRLAAEVRTAAERVSRFRDERPRMRPHLTIGRVAPTRAPRRGAPRLPVQVDHLVRALAVYQGPSWTVDDLLLESSVPGAGRGGGPRYETVRRLPLAAVAG